MKDSIKYVAFLRGINVGGHHKVPMAELRGVMAAMKFEQVETLLNSGNVIFSAPEKDVDTLEGEIAARLETEFGFQVPVLVRKGEEILQFYLRDPFQKIEATPDSRFYVSFLKLHPQEIELPWISEDQSFEIFEIQNRIVCSVLRLPETGTTKGMESLEKIFGRNITTRNWNTLERIAAKLKP